MTGDDEAQPDTRLARRLGTRDAVVIGLGSMIGAGVFAAIGPAAAAAGGGLLTNERRWPRPLTVAGLLGCIALAVALPPSSVIGGTVLLAAGAAVWAVRRRRPRTAWPFTRMR